MKEPQPKEKLEKAGPEGVESVDFQRVSKQLAERKEKEVQGITAKATVYVVLACSVSASTGLLFGYK